jgi:hypothetical protein
LRGDGSVEKVSVTWHTQAMHLALPRGLELNQKNKLDITLIPGEMHPGSTNMSLSLHHNFLM